MISTLHHHEVSDAMKQQVSTSTLRYCYLLLIRLLMAALIQCSNIMKLGSY